LDEYLRNPEAFGKPSGDTAPSGNKGNVASIDAKETKTYQPPMVARTNWVKLTHKGHISDYHGFSRKYENFFPLKSVKSVPEIQAEIRSTLNDVLPSIDDDDVSEELAIYERAIQRYEAMARNERSRRSRCKKLSSKKGTDGSMDDVVFFNYGRRHEGRAMR